MLSVLAYICGCSASTSAPNVTQNAHSVHLRLRPQSTSRNSALAEYVCLAAECMAVIGSHSVS